MDRFGDSLQRSGSFKQTISHLKSEICNHAPRLQLPRRLKEIPYFYRLSHHRTISRSTMADTAVAHGDILAEAKRRRTFAIISHPDAGKTTLTEKLLLYGGAIHE